MESESKNGDQEGLKNPEIYQASKVMETNDQLTNCNDPELSDDSPTNLPENDNAMLSSDLENTSGKELMTPTINHTEELSEHPERTLSIEEFTNGSEIPEETNKAIEIDEFSSGEVADVTTSDDILIAGVGCDYELIHSLLNPEVAEDQPGIRPDNKDQSYRASCNTSDFVKGGSSDLQKDPFTGRMLDDHGSDDKCSNSVATEEKQGIYVLPFEGDKSNRASSNVTESGERGSSDLQGTSGWLLGNTNKIKKFDEEQLKIYNTLRGQGLDHAGALIEILSPIPIDLPPMIPSVNVKLSKKQAVKLFLTLDGHQRKLFWTWREQGLDCRDAFIQVVGPKRVIEASKIAGLAGDLLWQELSKRVLADRESNDKSINSLLTEDKRKIGISNEEDTSNGSNRGSSELQKEPVKNKVLSCANEPKKFDEDQLKLYNTLREQGLEHNDALIKIPLLIEKPAMDLLPRVPLVDVKSTKKHLALLHSTLDEHQTVLYNAWLKQGLDRQDALTQVLGAECIIDLLKILDSKLPQSAITLSPRVPSVDVTLTKKQSAQLWSTLDEVQMMLYVAWKKNSLNRQDALTQVLGAERIVEASKIVEGVMLNQEFENPRDILKKPSFKESLTRNKRSELFKIFNKPTRQLYEFFLDQGFECRDAVIQVLDCNLPKEPRTFTKEEKYRFRKMVCKLHEDKKKVWESLRAQGWSSQDAAAVVHDISVGPVRRFRKSKKKKKRKLKLAEKRLAAKLEKAQRKLKSCCGTNDAYQNVSDLTEPTGLRGTIMPPRVLFARPIPQRQDLVNEIQPAPGSCILNHPVLGRTALPDEKNSSNFPHGLPVTGVDDLSLDTSYKSIAQDSYRNPQGAVPGSTFCMERKDYAAFTESRRFGGEPSTAGMQHRPHHMNSSYQSIARGFSRTPSVAGPSSSMKRKDLLADSAVFKRSRFGEEHSPHRFAGTLQILNTPYQSTVQGSSRTPRGGLCDESTVCESRRFGKESSPHYTAGTEQRLNSAYRSIAQGSSRTLHKTGPGLSSSMERKDLYADSAVSERSRVGEEPSTLRTAGMLQSLIAPCQSIAQGSSRTPPVDLYDDSTVCESRRFGEESSPHCTAGREQRLNSPYQSKVQGFSRPLPETGPGPSSPMERKDWYVDSAVSKSCRFVEEPSTSCSAGTRQSLNSGYQNIVQGSSRPLLESGLGPSSSVDRMDLYVDTAVSKKSRFGEDPSTLHSAGTLQSLSLPYQNTEQGSSRTPPVDLHDENTMCKSSRFGEEPSPHCTDRMQQRLNSPYQSIALGSSRTLPKTGLDPSFGNDLYGDSKTCKRSRFGEKLSPYRTARMQQPEQSTSSSSANNLHLSIVPFGYPSERFSEDQLYQIENGMLEAILNVVDSARPSFNKSFHNNGRFEVICEDRFSKEWLYNYASYIRAPFKIIPSKLFRVPANVLLPLSQYDDNDRILKFIANQNQGLNVRQWEVVERHDGDWNTSLRLMIDEESANLLKKRNKISFKMGTAEIVVNDNNVDYYY